MRIEKPPESGLQGISLRQLAPSDVSEWYDYLSLAAVVEHTSWNLRGLADLEAILSACEAPEPNLRCRLAIVDLAGKRLAGTIGFHTISAIHRNGELAYDLHPRYWGRGIATAVCIAVAAWAFETLHLVRVQATVLDTNTRSERVLQKCGFVCEGVLRSYRMVRGVPGDFKMYSRLAPHP